MPKTVAAAQWLACATKVRPLICCFSSVTVSFSDMGPQPTNSMRPKESYEAAQGGSKAARPPVVPITYRARKEVVRCHLGIRASSLCFMCSPKHRWTFLHAMCQAITRSHRSALHLFFMVDAPVCIHTHAYIHRYTYMFVWNQIMNIDASSRPVRRRHLPLARRPMPKDGAVSNDPTVIEDAGSDAKSSA